MFQRKSSITMLVLLVAVTLGLQRTGWLDRVVQYQKEKLFNELAEVAPVKITAEIQPKPAGYEDSTHWDYDSVLRLLTLIRESESAKPVHKALRRMLKPTRRLMMSIKQSKIRFPSIKKEDNEFYYDGYDSSKENELPAPPPVPEDQVVLVVSNPVEARLPSARISVKLLREILEARARAARQLPTTTKIPPWIDFIRNRTQGSTTATTGESTEDNMEPDSESEDDEDDNKNSSDPSTTESSSSDSSDQTTPTTNTTTGSEENNITSGNDTTTTNSTENPSDEEDKEKDQEEE